MLIIFPLSIRPLWFKRRILRTWILILISCSELSDAHRLRDFLALPHSVTQLFIGKLKCWFMCIHNARIPDVYDVFIFYHSTSITFFKNLFFPFLCLRCISSKASGVYLVVMVPLKLFLTTWRHNHNPTKHSRVGGHDWNAVIIAQISAHFLSFLFFSLPRLIA